MKTRLAILLCLLPLLCFAQGSRRMLMVPQVVPSGGGGGSSVVGPPVIYSSIVYSNAADLSAGDLWYNSVDMGSQTSTVAILCIAWGTYTGTPALTNVATKGGKFTLLSAAPYNPTAGLSNAIFYLSGPATGSMNVTCQWSDLVYDITAHFIVCTNANTNSPFLTPSAVSDTAAGLAYISNRLASATNCLLLCHNVLGAEDQANTCTFNSPWSQLSIASSTASRDTSAVSTMNSVNVATVAYATNVCTWNEAYYQASIAVGLKGLQ